MSNVFPAALVFAMLFIVALMSGCTMPQAAGVPTPVVPSAAVTPVPAATPFGNDQDMKTIGIIGRSAGRPLLCITGS